MVSAATGPSCLPARRTPSRVLAPASRGACALSSSAGSDGGAVYSVIPPTPGVLAPPKLGDAVVMNNCSAGDPHGAMHWAPCTGEDCFAPGASGVTPTRTSIRNPGGLCLDASGGFPGWAARIMPCDTTFDSEAWGNNPITSATWMLGTDGTLRTNVSRAGSPLNTSGEVCLFSSIPGGDPVNGDWWTSGAIGMWWCDGTPAESRWVFENGQLRAAAGPKQGLCLCSTDVALPTPKPPVPADPAHHTVRCPRGCLGEPCKSFPYCDPSLSAQVRAEDFVARLSLQEKANIIMWLGAHVPRLGTPLLTYGEAQHGLLKPCIDRQGVACTSPDTRECRCATSFPSLVGVGGTFNRTLFEQMGEVMGDEARAYYNVLGGQTNMVFFAPSINLARNVFWGRNQETPGEDPLVNGLYAVDFIRSIQGAPATDWADPHAAPLKAAATIKHFLGYSVECSSGGKVAPGSSRDAIGGGATATLFDCDAPGVDRFHFEGFISDADLNDYYLPVFKRPLRAAAPAAIMCSFASVNGVPSCANGLMQNTLARQSWGWDGFIVTDCGAVDFLNQGHFWTRSPAAAVAAAIHNGSDMEIGIPGPWGHGYYFQTHMNQTVESKLLAVGELDRAAIRVWRTAFRLGMFEPVASSPWGALGWEDIDSDRNQAASREAALQSLTLLKNEGKTLPLDPKSLRSLAVLGPFANSTVDLMGGYSGLNLRIASHSPSAVLQRRLAAVSPSTRLLFSAGAHNGANRTDEIEAAVRATHQADATVLFVGDTHVAEFSDRTWNGLEYAQVELIKAVCSTGKPVALIVVAGHSIDLTAAKESCSAIIFAFLPSQFGGDAIADVLLGRYSPAGRLPVTFYDSSVNLRSNFNPENMSLRHGNGVTYQHFRGTPLYEFGFGLSYSTFSFRWSSPPAAVSSTAHAAPAAVYRVTVTNTGQVAAGVAVLAFVNSSAAALAPLPGGASSVPTPPLRKLFNFTRTFLQPGASTTLEFSLGQEALALSDDAGDQAVRPGRYTVAIGGVGRAGRVEDGAVSAALELHGEPHVLFSMRELRGRYAEK